MVSGEIITADIDFAEINDLYLQTIYSFRRWEARRYGTGTRRPLCLTTMLPSPTIEALLATTREMRLFKAGAGLSPSF